MSHDRDRDAQDAVLRSAATGTDLGAIEALASIPESIDLNPFGGDLVTGIAQTLPGVIGALDTAQADPDNLYVTTSTEGEIEKRSGRRRRETRQQYRCALASRLRRCRDRNRVVAECLALGP